MPFRFKKRSSDENSVGSTRRPSNASSRPFSKSESNEEGPPTPPFDPSRLKKMQVSFEELENISNNRVADVCNFEETPFYVSTCELLKKFYFAYWDDQMTMPDVQVIVKAYFSRYGESEGLEQLNKVLKAKYGSTISEKKRSSLSMEEGILSNMVTKKRQSMISKLKKRFSSRSVEDILDDNNFQRNRSSSQACRKKPVERRASLKHVYSQNRRLSLAKLRFSVEDVKCMAESGIRMDAHRK